MNVKFLRASTINTYKDCEWSFFLQYIMEFPGQSGNKAALGSCIHLSLELLAKCRKVDHDKLKDKYSDPNYTTKIAFARFKKDYPQFGWTEKDYKFCLTNVMAVVNSKYNPLTLNILDTERQFEIEINKPGCSYSYIDPITGKLDKGKLRLRGTVDLITEVDSDTIEIIDYKSGQRTNWVGGGSKEYEDFMADMQLKVYDLATSMIYSKYKYRILTIIFTRDGGPFTVSFTEHDLKNTVDIIRRTFNDIRTNNNPKRLKDNSRRSPEKWKCRYTCPFGAKYAGPDGKTICDKTYQIFLKNDLESAHQQIYNISIDEKLKEKVSRRNDYGRAKIFKGVYNGSDGQIT